MTTNITDDTMNKVNKAIEIATKAHDGQTDRDGEAYILHPLTVGLMGKTDEERMAGFLHDVLEDTPVTAEDLLAEGIPASVVNALKLLTHDKSKPYFEYVQNIIDSHNPIALRVKFNDLTHTCACEEIANVTQWCASPISEHNFARGKAYPDLQKKHGKALEMVRKAIEETTKVSLYEPQRDDKTRQYGWQSLLPRENQEILNIHGHLRRTGNDRHG